MDKLYKGVPKSLQFNFKEAVLVLVGVNGAYLTSLMNHVGILSVFASFLFGYAVIVTVLMRVKNVSKDRSLVEDDHSFVSEDTAKAIAIFLHKIAFAIQSRVRAVHSPSDLRGIVELFVAFYLIGVVGTMFSPMSLIWIAANAVGLSSILASNEKARATFDNLTVQAKALIDRGSGILTSKIPKYSDLKRD